jgi:hypothetical protein
MLNFGFREAVDGDKSVAAIYAGGGVCKGGLLSGWEKSTPIGLPASSLSSILS